MRSIYQKYLLIIVLVIINYSLSYSQSNISFKIISLSIQPLGSENSHIISSKLDDNGIFVIEPGVALSYESFVLEDIVSFQFQQGIYADCASQLAGFSHLGIKWRILKKWKQSFSIGIGPTLHYRNDWSKINGYKDEGIYDVYGNWQYRLFMISGEMEYSYYLSKKSDLSVSLIHKHTQAFTIAIGYKYWINKKVRRKKRKCISCPTFH